MSNKSSTAMQGTALWQKQPKANAELFALTYGALVSELVRDLETPAEIQEQLDSMGHSIGVRCIEEYLAKQDSMTAGTPSFQESAATVQIVYRMFLGIVTETAAGAAVSTTEHNPDSVYSISFTDNPLALFVELPSTGPLVDLEYSQLLCGWMRGVLEMLQFDVVVTVEKSTLRGDDTNTLQVELKQVLQQGAGEDYQEE